MSKIALAIALAQAATAQPQQSSTTAPVEAWKTTDERVVAIPSAISLPARAGPTVLYRTREISSPGKAVDNVANYHSADGAMEVSVYVYLAAFPDAALASFLTEAAIRMRFGAGSTLASQTVVTAGGLPGAAIRNIFTGAKDQTGELSTAAAFLATGRWIVKIRVTGPAARRGEVEQAIDAVLTGMRFEGTERPRPIEPLSFAAPCPLEPGNANLLKPGKDSGAQVLAAAMIGYAVGPQPDAAYPPPRNGAVSMCVAGTFGPLTLMRAADDKNGKTVLMPFSDAGNVLAVEPQLIGKGYRVKRYNIGSMEVMGAFDRMPSPEQLGAIITGRDPAAARIMSRTNLTVIGKIDLQIDTEAMK